MKNKVLFLDIDGVLHSLDSPVDIIYEPTKIRVVGPRLFEFAPILSELLAGHAVDIVVHSSWRQHMPFDDLCGYFPDDLRARIVGITDPDLSRQESIEAYIQDFGVTDFAVLDDMHEAWKGRSELILCDDNLGIYDFRVQQKLKTWLQK